MKRLHFTYNMLIEYSSTVSNGNFTVKCIPVNTLRQKIERFKISLYPDCGYQWGTDGFKNRYIWGGNTEPHTSFMFGIEGDAVAGLSSFEEQADDSLTPVFSHSHGLNLPGKNIKAFYEEKKKDITESTYEKVLKTTQLLFQNMEYKPGSTNVDTSAEEAFSQGCGVCQDYAHILISLLHLSGIPARYVTGFIVGEGASHAWVEFLDGNKWYGVDPTNNKAVTDEYIKIGNGRDAKDCMINRGIILGGGRHIQTVKASVLEVLKG